MKKEREPWASLMAIAARTTTHAPLTAFRVTYDNGDVLMHQMAAGITLAQARAHYVGQRFEITETTFHTGVSVEAAVVDESTHTPGPWSIDVFNTPNGQYFDVVHIWKDDEGEAHTDHIAEVTMDYMGERPLANAILLAAAPDLAACCQEALDWIIDSFRKDERPLALVSALRAAIIKAEGGAG